ncbi:MAG: ABC transporter ATP-binding protein [Actinomycetota bacterium]
MPASHATGHEPAAISFENVGIRFGRGEWVLDALNLTIRDGEFFVLVGSSGCGKSTVLKLVAGIEHPTVGQVCTHGVSVSRPGPDRAVVFQSVDEPLMDWLTVKGNINFALKLAGVSRDRRPGIIKEQLERVGLRAAAAKFPDQLSGGMKQRVQIARVLAVDPAMLLMDEPFAALDAQSRRFLQQELVRLWTEQRRTVMYITHDVREAVLLGQRVAVMSAPPSSQIKDIFEIDLPYPRDEFQSEFVDYCRVVERSISEEVQRQWSRDAG